MVSYQLWSAYKRGCAIAAMEAAEPAVGGVMLRPVLRLRQPALTNDLQGQHQHQHQHSAVRI